MVLYDRTIYYDYSYSFVNYIYYIEISQRFVKQHTRNIIIIIITKTRPAGAITLKRNVRNNKLVHLVHMKCNLSCTFSYLLQEGYHNQKNIQKERTIEEYLIYRNNI